MACDPNGGIGLAGQLPWTRINGDLPRFKSLTTGKTVIMGRNTYNSLPVKPLPHRDNIVITKTQISGVVTFPDITALYDMDHSDAWLIGGAKLVNSTWDLITEIHLTRTFDEYQCDTFIDLHRLYSCFCVVQTVQHIDHYYDILLRYPTVYK